MTLSRNIRRQRWLSSIYELTSLELQRTSWLGQHTENPHWSFVEFYFDDLLCNFPYSRYVEIGWVLAEEYEILKYWHEALRKYQSPNNHDYDNTAVLADKNWLEIVRSGARAKVKLAM